MTVPRVKMTALFCECGVEDTDFALACEAVAVALTRNRVLVVETVRDDYHSCIDELFYKQELSQGFSALPGRRALEWRLQTASPFVVSLAVQTILMDKIARSVLRALCRSSLLRLRGDVFSPFLDDLPLPEQQRSSSTLTLTEFTDNFSSLPAEARTAVAPLFDDPQEPATERSVLSVMVPLEASDARMDPVSGLQVQSASGVWQDVSLQSHELAIVPGALLEHLTAGLVQPALHRVVGTPYGTADGGLSRRLAHYELLPRPSAVLDCTAQLAAAGHNVSARFASPASVKSLMQQFETLLSPKPGAATPALMESAAAHAAWEKARATSKKGKRRSEVEELIGSGDCGLPRTRSGRVRRSSGSSGGRTGDKENAGPAGMGSGQPGTAGAPAAGGGGAGPSGSRRVSGSRRPSELFGRSAGKAQAALYQARGKLCVVVDGCLEESRPEECVVLGIRTFTGLEKWFYVDRMQPLGRVFECFCERSGVALASVRFTFKGERVYGADTAESKCIADGQELIAVPESSDRLVQLRELGPLFTSVLGGDVPDRSPSCSPLVLS